ncbi:NAD-P-binding protein [Stereum hirsutum FP-91666 SS1]|uniref:NAD-P-binding protein n=1 Tax=Stereum hirsutum (strain FP-91666) TaxID=721885 RepID=UPI000440DDF5|nr:NAD-P-binding protein [Stereum hirsutum FP-91666 SS1]EIM88909.1 NAD-P-binding protein [Stereum hirsutum FP-91666 SS1]
MSPLPIAIVFGGSGLTGTSIVNGLLERKEFEVKVPVRPSSVDKPSVVELRNKGVAIIPVDLATASSDHLQEILRGANTVICSLVYTQLGLQHKIIEAAKAVGVPRFVPCDFGTPGRRGVRKLHDEKLDIQDAVKASGIGYTFIDVGFWYQLHLIYTDVEKAYVPWLYEASRYVYNDGLVKTAYTDLTDIGRFVARIVADPRTLNHHVFAWGEEITQQDLVNLARKYGDPNVEVIRKTTADLEALVAEAKEKKLGTLAYWDYHYSMWVLGENRAEVAKLEGALDARELYPDYKVRPLEDYAVEFYKCKLL